MVCGYIKDGESPWNAGKRKIKEETGIQDACLAVAAKNLVRAASGMERTGTPFPVYNETDIRREPTIVYPCIFLTSEHPDPADILKINPQHIDAMWVPRSEGELKRYIIHRDLDYALGSLGGFFG